MTISSHYSFTEGSIINLLSGVGGRRRSHFSSGLAHYTERIRCCQSHASLPSCLRIKSVMLLYQFPYSYPGMDILRMGIESIDSFDAKSYEYRIKFLGVRFDVESNGARLIRYSIASNRTWRISFDIRIEPCMAVRRSNRTNGPVHEIRSIRSNKPSSVKKSSRRVRQNMARRANKWGGATRVISRHTKSSVVRVLGYVRKYF